MKLASFNLRMPALADGENYLPKRIPLITERVLKEMPDVIGFQEMEDSGLLMLTGALPEYLIIGPGRNTDFKGEGCRIALRKSSITLLSFDQCWLSPTPRVPGSRFEIQSRCPRVVAWCKLLHNISGKRFYFINTHLDHEAEEARMLGLQMILQLAEKLKAEEDLPIFITGDFNFSPAEKPYTLIEDSRFVDTTAELTGTYHGYGNVQPVKIDYILTNHKTGDYRAEQWHECRDGIYLSDHDPVCIEWK